MSLLFWGAASLYLIAAAVTLLGADLRFSDDAKDNALLACALSLVFAAAWPVRALRLLLRGET